VLAIRLVSIAGPGTRPRAVVTGSVPLNGATRWLVEPYPVRWEVAMLADRRDVPARGEGAPEGGREGAVACVGVGN
jgi:hypothetical protein